MKNSLENNMFMPASAPEDTMGQRVQLIEAIRASYRKVMNPHIPIGSRVAVVDFPNYGNVGDSAIWLGQMRYFEERNVSLVAVCAQETCNVRKLGSHLGREGIVAVNGGGNFGDLWPKHHAFFHRILQNFPHHKVVQLPQSVFWSSSERRAADCEAMNRHPDLTLFARDRTSLRILQENCRHPVHLCPDSAMFLNLARPVPPTRDVVALMRADKEKGSVELALPVPPEDWTKDGTDLGFRLARRLQRRLMACGDGSWSNHRVLYDYLAEARLERGCRQIGRGRVVVTDRLHVHILACLMDIPHVLIDNSYGKLSTFRECWTKEFPKHVYLRNPTELEAALEVVRSMV